MPIPVYKRVPTQPRLRLQFLPVSQAYAFTFGDALIRMHVADCTFYQHKTQAIADARLCGLAVDDVGEISIIP